MKIDATVTMHYVAYGQFRTEKFKTGGWGTCYIEQRYAALNDAKKAAAVLKRGGCKNVKVLRVKEWAGFHVVRTSV